MNKNIGEVIATIRKRREMSQKDLAIAAGIHPVTISKVEDSNWEPSGKMMKKIAKALRVPLAYMYLCCTTIEDFPEERRPSAALAMPQITGLFESIL